MFLHIAFGIAAKLTFEIRYGCKLTRDSAGLSLRDGRHGSDCGFCKCSFGHAIWAKSQKNETLKSFQRISASETSDVPTSLYVGSKRLEVASWKRLNFQERATNRQRCPSYYWCVLAYPIRYYSFPTTGLPSLFFFCMQLVYNSYRLQRWNFRIVISGLDCIVNNLLWRYMEVWLASNMKMRGITAMHLFCKPWTSEVVQRSLQILNIRN